MTEQRGKPRKSLLQYAPYLMGVFVVLLLVHDVFGTHGYLAMRKKRQEIQKISAELDKLNKENLQLQQDAQDMQSDPETIRKIAREEYGLAGPNEKIIKMPAPKPAAPPVGQP